MTYFQAVLDLCNAFVRHCMHCISSALHHSGSLAVKPVLVLNLELVSVLVKKLF